MNIFELACFASVVMGSITGAFAGARHGFLGIVLGGAGGLVFGFLSFVGTLSPLALGMSVAAPDPELEHPARATNGVRAKFENLLGWFGLFVLPLLAPIVAGALSWWLVRLISG